MTTIAFDIETTGFDRKKDTIIAFAYASIDGETLKSYNCIDLSELELLMEMNIAFSSSSRIITWNGASFDMPFVSSRASIAGIRMPNRTHIDLYSETRSLFTESGRSLDSVTKSLSMQSNNLPFSGKIWSKAAKNDIDAIKYVTNHCENDVKMLRDIWKRIME